MKSAQSFREHHLFTIFRGFEEASLPIDVFLSDYFRSHKQIGSHDRREIGDTVYGLIRWKSALDSLSKSKPSWEERYKNYKNFDPKAYQLSSHIEPHTRLSFPKDYFDLLKAQYGEEKALEICWVSNTPAPTTIRVNALKTTREELLAKWQDKHSIEPCLESDNGIRFLKKIHLTSLDEFKEGLFEIQDEGSQKIATLVEVQPKEHLLDFCAGSGGKTLAIAPSMQKKGQIYLHDIRPFALQQAKKRLRRAGVQNAQFLFPDDLKKEPLKGKMDWVLADVPCSGSGTLRRNPDMKWKFTNAMLASLIEDQRKILTEAYSFVKKDGKLVYMTCSVFQAENEEQIAWLQSAFRLKLMKCLSFLPEENGKDGFFGAVLQRA